MIGMGLVNTNLSVMIATEFDRWLMAFAKTEAEWEARAGAFLKAELKKANVTYAQLVGLMKKHGFKETEASITNKLKRGTFNATWFLAALVAIGRDTVRLEEI